MAAHGDDIARLLRGEVEPLSTQERDEVLRHRLSYLATDLVVPSWNGAFVYDTEAGLPGALEILEFANSQLLQFRYYDQRLDRELARIYAQLQATAVVRAVDRPPLHRRRARAARALHRRQRAHRPHRERAEARGRRLRRRACSAWPPPGSDSAWKDAVRDKLKTLDDIYRFAVDQTAMDRGEVLEAAIVLILVFELVLFFMGIMT